MTQQDQELCKYSMLFDLIMTDMRLSSWQRTLKLATLLTMLERSFSIPCLQDKEWESQHPHILELYLKVSSSRDI